MSNGSITTQNPNLFKTFNEKVSWLLSYIYEHGGNEYKGGDYNSYGSYMIPGASSPDEFNRMVEALIAKGWVSCGLISPGVGGPTFYMDMKLTELGINEAEKALPQLPMIGLVNQEITTGDSEVDAKINHAKELFFREPKTIDNMRSACEALHFVLEPLKKKLKDVFADADVNVFFRLVNDFDIRHNKGYTEQLQHEEQLEWVFYTLLNTINTYTKLKDKLGA